MSNMNGVGNSTKQETGLFFTPTSKQLIIRNYTGIGTHDKERVLRPNWSFLLAGRYCTQHDCCTSMVLRPSYAKLIQPTTRPKQTNPQPNPNTTLLRIIVYGVLRR